MPELTEVDDHHLECQPAAINDVELVLRLQLFETDGVDVLIKDQRDLNEEIDL